jgi:hypothetical protein
MGESVFKDIVLLESYVINTAVTHPDFVFGPFLYEDLLLPFTLLRE